MGPKKRFRRLLIITIIEAFPSCFRMVEMYMLFLSHLEQGRYEVIATAVAYSVRTVGFAFNRPWAIDLLC